MRQNANPKTSLVRLAWHRYSVDVARAGRTCPWIHAARALRTALLLVARAGGLGALARTGAHGSAAGRRGTGSIGAHRATGGGLRPAIRRLWSTMLAVRRGTGTGVHSGIPRTRGVDRWTTRTTRRGSRLDRACGQASARHNALLGAIKTDAESLQRLVGLMSGESAVTYPAIVVLVQEANQLACREAHFIL